MHELEPSPAQMGETMTVAAREWTPLDDIGTEIYVYGEQSVDIAVQTADADAEIRQLRDELATAREQIESLRGQIESLRSSHKGADST